MGATLTAVLAGSLLLLNSYNKVEKWIIGFVSVIGLAFLYELWLVPAGWVPQAAVGWVKPCFPEGSMLVIMSVLGAVVMPHNLFLHSEIIQSRQWNLEGEAIIKKGSTTSFDTLFAMLVGWAINSAMIIWRCGVLGGRAAGYRAGTGPRSAAAPAGRRGIGGFCRGSAVCGCGIIGHLGHGRG